MTRVLIVLAAPLLLGAWQQAVDPQAALRKDIRVLADAGKLDEAERSARAGGPTVAATLGGVLVLRGKHAAADSAFRVAIDRDRPGLYTAEVGLAELANAHGNRAEALARATLVISAYEKSGTPWPADDQLAAGRAYVLFGSRSATSVRQALAAFDRAVAADPGNLEGRLRAGDLFLEKYNPPDAKASYQDVLSRSPENAWAWLGMARVAEFEGNKGAMEFVRHSVAANPALVGGHVLLARFHLEAEAYDSARIAAGRALAVDSTSLPAWALLGAEAYLTGDSAAYQQARAAALRLNPRPADFYAALSEAAARHRRYADSERFAREAVALDSTSVRALGLVGTNQLRAGNIESGRATIERAFALDPFNLWHKNTLDLLDQVKTFKTIDRGRFRIVAPPTEADLLALYLVPLLEQEYDSLSVRYRFKPPTPVRIELYRQHADFSVRTLGLTGLGALGVSFGGVLAMDAPSAREKSSFNWGSTAWHELAHTFTLGLSSNRVPRWFSEGLSELEERRSLSGWGTGPSIEFLAAYTGGRLHPVSSLNDGFVRPRFDSEVVLSYYLASLVCEMIEAQHGSAAIVAMLNAYRDGLETPAVFTKVLGETPAAFDGHFDSWVRAKFALPLRSIAVDTGSGTVGGAFVNMMRAASALPATGQDSSRVALLREAQAMFPDYAGPDAPAVYLARLAQARNDLRGALEQIVKITTRNETAWDANMMEATLRQQLGDSVGALVPLQRLIWISPYDIGVHTRIAEIARAKGDRALALRERRAVVALDPPDAAGARYELARALVDAGDVPGARKELLAVLEQAPAFEKAQTLLLELRNKTP
ncbi:MAG: tetratricopeptide repeat protein [bacterium]